MPPLAVLFDFDGVIADTENVHVAAWQRTLGRLGWDLSDETAQRVAEVDDRIFLEELFAEEKVVGGDVEGWLRVKQVQTEKLLADAPRIYPGVIALVQELRRRDVRLAVVTTTWRANVAITLKSAGIFDAFETIVAKEDVEFVKPSPLCYLQALVRLGITADQAIAIEDSPTGATSAQAAGLPVFAVGHRRPKGPWAGDLFVTNLKDLNLVLKQLGLG